MIEADWGWDDGPLRLPGRPSSTCEVVTSNDVEDLPDVRVGREHGYVPAPENPMWCFVPAVWPATARGWVPDVRVRTSSHHHSHSYGDAHPEQLPWTAADYAEIEQDALWMLTQAGVPPRPTGRVWLLRGPHPDTSALDLLDEISAAWAATGGHVMSSEPFAAFVAEQVRRAFA